MSNIIQIIAITLSSLLLLFIVELVRRRVLVEEYSFVWMMAGLGLLLISIFRGVLDRVALWMGIFYPPSLLLLGLTLFVFVQALLFTIVLSRHRHQIHCLYEELSLLSVKTPPEKKTEPSA